MSITITKTTSGGTQDVDIVGQSGADPLNVDLASDVVIDSSTPVNVSVVPAFESQQPNIFYLKNGGSENMLVNGSGTPVTFTHTATRKMVVESLTLSLGSFLVGQQGHGNFGAVNGLSNGIEITATIGGVSNTINRDRNIYNNADLITQASRLTTTTFERSGDEGVFYVATFDFSHLTGGGYVLDAADSISVVIQDNLATPAGAGASNGLNLFHANVKVARRRP
jgi:hypothetical protein